MINLIKIFFKQRKLVSIGGLVFILGLSSFSIFLSFQFLNWYKDFYDSLQNKDIIAFYKGLLDFTILSGAYILQNTVLKFVNQRYTLEWREALTYDILKKWRGQYIEGYSQRIQEDCYKFSKLFETLFVGCFTAIVSLIVFIPVLLEMSRQIFPNFPLTLILVCLGYTFAGLALSFFLGRKLPKLEYNNQKVEAKLRRALEFKKGRYKKLFKKVKKNYLILFDRYKVFNFFSSSYFQLSVILPYIIVGKFYFQGIITLGAMVQLSKAFNKVNDSMTYLIDNWLQITELQSVILRLNEFYNKLNKR